MAGAHEVAPQLEIAPNRPVFNRLMRIKPLAVLATTASLFAAGMASRSSEVVEQAAANHQGWEGYDPEYYQKAYDSMPSNFDNRCQEYMYPENKYRPCTEDERRHEFAHNVISGDKHLGWGNTRPYNPTEASFIDKKNKKYNVLLRFSVGSTYDIPKNRQSSSDFADLGERQLYVEQEFKRPEQRKWRRGSNRAKFSSDDTESFLAILGYRRNEIDEGVTLKSGACSYKRGRSKKQIRRIERTKERPVVTQVWISYYGKSGKRVNRGRIRSCPKYKKR